MGTHQQFVWHSQLLTELALRRTNATAVQQVRPGPWKLTNTHIDGVENGGQRIFSEIPLRNVDTGWTAIKLVVDVPLHPMDKYNSLLNVPLDLATYFITEHPGDALRRYKEELALLERHKPLTQFEGQHPLCAYEWLEYEIDLGWETCPEVLSTARRLGVDTAAWPAEQPNFE